MTIRNEVWALTEDCLTRLLSFLESKSASTEEDTAVEQDCPLPIKLRFDGRRREDGDNSIPEHNIYRDRWERKMRYDRRSDFEFGLGGKDCEELFGLDEEEYPDLY